MAHTIGSLALLGMLIIAGASFAMVTSSLQVDVTKEQLSAVGEYIAIHIVEMATIVDTSNLNYSETGKIMIRNITLPPDIQGKAYVIKLVCRSSNLYFVRLFMLTRPDISVEVQVPLGQGGGSIVLLTGLLPSMKNIDSLHSGEGFRFAVWGFRNGSLYVGLARWEV